MSDLVYVTAEGLEKLKAEYKERTEVRRFEIADRLDKAIKMGDLKENADYHVAKEDQAFNEGKIKALQDAIFRASIIATPQAGSKEVRIGATIIITEDGSDEEEEYKIVGAQEANPLQGLISNESPIGRALIGARVGNTVSAETPGGTMRFKVLKIN